MAIIKCKMCGGDIELSEDRTYGTCDSCGSIVTLPKIDDEQRAAAFNRGNHFRRMGEFDKALAVYERIVQEDDTDAEAHWCCALCRFGIEYVEDPATREYLPTCHRASFDSFLEDVDYLAALECSDGVTRRQYQKEAEKIAEVQRGILATSQNEKPFDVFICYKESDEKGDRTRDSMLAQDIYYQLTEQGLRVFFSRITLEDKAGTQYEPYIFAALNSAKVMIVVGTRPEYMNAVWVKNEWSRFLALMRHDRTKLLIPCYRDMDPYDLPEQLSVLQAYDMSKIGFVQDLIRGVMKVLGKDKKPAPIVETRVVQQTENSANITALLKRGDMALEDGNWNEANGYFDRVLDMDAECAQAYMGKFLAAWQCKSLEQVFQSYLDQFSRVETINDIAVGVDYDRMNAVVAQAVAPESAWSAIMTTSELADFKKRLRGFFAAIDRSYSSWLEGYEKLADQGKTIFVEDKLFSRALQFAKGSYLAELRKKIGQFNADLDAQVEAAKQADEKNIAKVREEYAQELDRAERRAMAERESMLESAYEKARAQLGSANIEKVILVEGKFKALAVFNYKDSAEKARECRRKAQQLKKAKKRKTSIFIIIGVILLLAAIFVIFNLIYLIPRTHYRAGEALLAAGNYDGAAEEFQKAVYYSDASIRMQKEYYSRGESLLSTKDLEYERKKAEAAIAFGAAQNYQDAHERSMQLWSEIAVRNTVAAGFNHTVGLKIDGRVVATGYKLRGQCDVSDGYWRNMVAVAAGDNYTIGLKANGTVVATGWNIRNQCDVSGWWDIVAVAAGSWHTIGLKSDGTVVATGNDVFGQCNVSDWRDIIAVAAGHSHTIGVKSDGAVIATGSNSDGQCNVSDWRDIVAVAAGQSHTIGVKSDGTVIATGSNVYGQCNVSDWQNIVAIVAGGNCTVGLKADGTVVATGENDNGQCNVSGWQNIVAIATSCGYHTVGLKADGKVVATGKNDDGQCNVSGWTNIRVP